MGNFPESLSQAILVGIVLVGKLGVHFGVIWFWRVDTRPFDYEMSGAISEQQQKGLVRLMCSSITHLIIVINIISIIAIVITN